MLSQYLFCRNKIFHILGIKTFLSNLRIRGAKKAKNIPGRYPIRRMKKISKMLRLRRKKRFPRPNVFFKNRFTQPAIFVMLKVYLKIPPRGSILPKSAVRRAAFHHPEAVLLGGSLGRFDFSDTP